MMNLKSVSVPCFLNLINANILQYTVYHIILTQLKLELTIFLLSERDGL
jgi:hypothetical protein